MAVWMAQARCRNLTPALFTGPNRQEPPHTQHTRETRALAVCDRCPVQQPCLDHALTNPHNSPGVIAGATTHTQRQHIAAVRERAADRLRKPKAAATYRTLWDGGTPTDARHTTGPVGADHARKTATRHLAEDGEAAQVLGTRRVMQEAVHPVNRELRIAVADRDQDAITHILDGLPTAHRAALLIEFADALGAAP
ncbi:WhiB family transcriptional regulator [Nocardiopsis sp. LOL_012]|uniref:WhiB family transcriptional regulator n=1 Tax=Nocardiopsis sp. LOL_012 TaxID=3345409 RepID=UPI003A863464